MEARTSGAINPLPVRTCVDVVKLACPGAPPPQPPQPRQVAAGAGAALELNYYPLSI